MKLRITIAGKAYEVDVEVLEEDEAQPLEPEPLHVQVTNPVAEPEDGGAEAGDKTCRSPVTGMVIRVNAAPGQAVDADQVLVVLEAMKMETHVTAPCAGTVERVHVMAGSAVKADQVLVELA